MSADCGLCALCCKLLAIDEVKSPVNQWCEHCKPGLHACQIYADRPASCEGFKCLWLASQEREAPLPASLRPDRSKVIMQFAANGEDLVLHVDPGSPRAWQENDRITSMINACLAAGREVIVVIGERRALISPSADTPKQQLVHEAKRRIAATAT